MSRNPKIIHPDDGIRWLATPPERKALRRKADWEWLVDKLRMRPGTWAEIAQVHRAPWYVPLRSNGLVDQMKKHGCEVRLRNDNEQITHIYARWVSDA